jgi:hypothetical protein
MDSITSTPTEQESLANLHAQDVAYLRGLFLGMADLGAGIVRVIARAVEDSAADPASTPSQIPALAAAYDQTMRSLRRTGLLIQKLTESAPAQALTAQSRDAGRHLRDRDAPADFSKLSDAELDRIDRVEGVESDDELAQRPLPEIIATILSDFGVTGLNGADGCPPITPADVAALYECATGLVAARRAGDAGGWPMDRGAAAGMSRDGATGCRDP